MCVMCMCRLLCCCSLFLFFFFKQKTACEMLISDWSSDVCSSDLGADLVVLQGVLGARDAAAEQHDEIEDQEADRHGIDGSFRAIRPDAIEQVYADIIAELHGIGAAEQEVDDHKEQIGRPSCRERGCLYVESSAVTGNLKNEKTQYKNNREKK